MHQDEGKKSKVAFQSLDAALERRRHDPFRFSILRALVAGPELHLSGLRRHQVDCRPESQYEHARRDLGQYSSELADGAATPRGASGRTVVLARGRAALPNRSAGVACTRHPCSHHDPAGTQEEAADRLCARLDTREEAMTEIIPAPNLDITA